MFPPRAATPLTILTQVLTRLLSPRLPGRDLPTSFEVAGHLAHLNLKDYLLPYQRIIGQVLAHLFIFAGQSFEVCPPLCFRDSLYAEYFFVSTTQVISLRFVSISRGIAHLTTSSDGIGNPSAGRSVARMIINRSTCTFPSNGNSALCWEIS